MKLDTNLQTTTTTTSSSYCKIAFLFYFLFSFFSIAGFSQNCAERDRVALTIFYNATSKIPLENWLSNKPLSEWEGVRTNEQGCVIALELSHMDVGGVLSPALGDLSELTELSLAYIDLAGTIPVELEKLSKLTKLDLRHNKLTGAIPASLEKLSKLTRLDLSYNELTGAIPSGLGKLSKLTRLQLHINYLTGAIPAELGQLSKLIELDFDHNDLTGSIPPSLGNLTNLTELSLIYNDLSGAIPAALGNLTKLQVLNLRNNDLTGSIPSTLGTLTQLKEFFLNNNNLSGCFPTSFSNLCYLATTALNDCSYNNGGQLEGCQYDFTDNPQLSWQGDFSRFCNNEIDQNCTTVAEVVDYDNDGYEASVDCDDRNPAINPGAVELPNNGIDENCDGIVARIDYDNDGYDSSVDCDDRNPAINPGAIEIPDNGIDDNCDGEDLVTLIITAIDNDNDGYNADMDCDDTNPAINPGAMEIPNNGIDEDCDGVDIVTLVDNDNDGYDAENDCDDNNARINPGRREIPNNGIDEDCNGVDLVICTLAMEVETRSGACGQSSSIAITISGGQNNYTIRWSGAATGSAVTADDTYIISGVVSGEYTITVEDATGCTTDQNISLTSSNERIGLELLVVDDINCGDLGKIGVTGITGSAPYNISWDGPSIGTISTSENQYAITGLMAGTYTVIIEDANGCYIVQEATINNLALYFCLEETLSNNATTQDLQIDVQQGIAPYAVRIWNDSGFDERSEQATNSFLLNNIPADRYYIEVVDYNGCQQSKAFEVGVRANTLQATICEGAFYSFGERTYTQTGVYRLTSCSGNSSRFLNLTVLSPEDCESIGLYNTATEQASLERTAINGQINTNTTPLKDTPHTLRLYPNPATSFVNIQLQDFNSELVSLTVLTLTGREIYQYTATVNEDTIALPVTDFPSGTYLVRAIDKQGVVAVEKLVIQ